VDPTVKRFNIAPLEYLFQEQMRDIHSTALEILEDGRRNEHGTARQKKVRHILDNYRPQPLQAEVDAEIDKILGKIKGGGNE